MYRNTYALINLNNIKYNVEKIITKYNNFDYYFGVVKANAYGHGDIKVSSKIIDAGVNYLVVAILEEALNLRKYYKDIPILCLGIVLNKDIEKAIKNKITLSITSKDYLDNIDLKKLRGATVHIKVNTGMNRLGVSSLYEFNYVYEKLINNNVNIEGIYSHLHSSNNKEKTNAQFHKFEEITSNIDLSKIKIVHIEASDAITLYDKPSYVNGARLGIIMYGFTNSKTLHLKSTFKLYSRVIQINKLKKNDTLGYNATYKAIKNEKIAVIPIGYADGIIRKYKGLYVYINNKPYKIIGNICMDMLFVKIDESVKLFDKVEIIKDNSHILDIANHLDTISYEIICNISNRVPRLYK